MEIKLCECGCGEPAPLASKTNKGRGWVKNQPIRFIVGHNGRMRPNGIIAFIVDDESGCWNWNRSIMSNGYGHLTISNQQILAHRFVYEKLRGVIPSGLTLDHLCRNPLCVNPDHLEPVTHAENCRRGAMAKLSSEKAAAIRAASGETATELARRYGVDRHTISSVLRGASWAT